LARVQVFIDRDVAPIDVADDDNYPTAVTVDRLSPIDENEANGRRQPRKSRVKLHK